MNPLAILQEIPEFEHVPKPQLQWLLDHGEIKEFQSGEHLFQPGDNIDKLLILLDGQANIKSQQGNHFRIVAGLEKYAISGYLPYSRADKAFGYAEATTTTHVFRLDKSKFREMINENEELTTALVHTMSSRIRSFTKHQQQNDKMMALGKLSAGLAHELNNPSAAIVRSAQNLGKHLKQIPEGFKKVIRINMTDEQVDIVNDILFSKINSEKPKLSMMEKSSLEDDLLDWLEENDVEGAEELAENMAAFGFELDDLDKISVEVPAKDLEPVINWMNQNLVTDSLIDEITDASQRINKLVTSVKSYTHMDQAPEKKPTDIHIGIDNTLAMLNHKINKNGIKVIKDFDFKIAEPSILVSEMNQVWTNIIDNAVDAMENTDSKTLTIRTTQAGDFINIFIADSGSGIPEDAQGKVFDPFFTTKAIGQGTGLGMEVVQQIITQHNGSVTFETRPGFTEFKVCLPIK